MSESLKAPPPKAPARVSARLANKPATVAARSGPTSVGGTRPVVRPASARATAVKAAPKPRATTSADDNPPPSGAVAAPRLGRAPVVDLPKVRKKPAAAMTDAATKHKITLGGTYQAGKFSTAHVHKASMPNELDYAGHRGRQILHHFSEVLRWHLEQNELTPVEVQAQYLKRDGQLHLAVSANEHASQKFLRDMSGDDLEAMYKAALTKGDYRVRASAGKILRIRDQNRQRREADAERDAPLESEADLADAAALSAMMRDRDQFSVAVNAKGRHAEQNLRKAFSDVFGAKQAGDQTDVAGTLIRCGACTAAMGPDEKLGKMLLRAGKGGTQVSGKLYPAQADKADWDSYFKKVQARELAIEVRRSKRPYSMSPVAPARGSPRSAASPSRSPAPVTPKAKPLARVAVSSARRSSPASSSPALSTLKTPARSSPASAPVAPGAPRRSERLKAKPDVWRSPGRTVPWKPPHRRKPGEDI